VSTLSRWRLAPQPLAEALRRWNPRAEPDRRFVNEALMDLVIYPFARGMEDPSHPGIFECEVGDDIVIVFVPTNEPDPEGIYWIAVTDILYTE
jgi:hypothetical protein